MSYNNLENYYSTIFSLVQHHKYSQTEIECNFPYERDLYIDMLNNYIKSIEKEE